MSRLADTAHWERMSRRADGKPLTERGQDRKAQAAVDAACKSADELMAAALRSPSAEDAAFALAMALSQIGTALPNGRVREAMHLAVSHLCTMACEGQQVAA